MTQQLHDSGERRTFSTGAVRDRGDLKPRPDLISPHTQMREGMIMTLGAQKYATRNWEAGLPISECLASAQRHIEQYKRGDTDEDHMAQARWNLGVIIHYEEEIKAGRMDPKIDDMPKYAQRYHNPIFGCEYYVDKLECKESHPSYPDTHIPEDPETLTGAEDDGCPFGPGWVSKMDSGGKVYWEKDAIIEPGGRVQAAAQPKGIVYIAGPMRGLPLSNFPIFDQARDRWNAWGYAVISPADLDRAAGFDPTVDPEAVCNLDLGEMIRRDLIAILDNLKPNGSDAIALLPGWENSEGAAAEIALGKFLKLKFVDALTGKWMEV